MSKKKFGGNLGGKGYYIALVLCAAAIGISGFLYYRNNDQTDAPALQADGTIAANGELNKPQAAVQPDGEETTVSTQPGQTLPVKPRQTASPVEGQTVAVYAMDSLTYNETTRDWRVHNGVDIAAEAGTKVCAAADGEVYTVYEDDTMGMTVVIRHDSGYTTKYSSLDKEVAVEPGDTVKVGQTIGAVGSTALLETAIGDHVHFSVTCDGKNVDPAEFLGQE